MNEREIDEIDNEEYMLNEMYTGPTTEMYTVPIENNNCKGKNGWIIFLLLTTSIFFGLFINYLLVSTKCKEKPTNNNKINFDELTSSPEFEKWLLHGKGNWRNRRFDKISRIFDHSNYVSENNTKSKDAQYSTAITGYEPRGNHFAQPGDDFGF